MSRAALVTGAGSGIGRATAVALAGRGVPVACADVDPSAASAVAAVEERLGGLGLVAVLAAIEGVREWPITIESPAPSR